MSDNNTPPRRRGSSARGRSRSHSAKIGPSHRARIKKSRQRQIKEARAERRANSLAGVGTDDNR